MTSRSRADSTRDRIVTAATAEFSRYGIAGSRIDRIARTAKTSKERVYAYFRSKEVLYRYVVAEELAAVAEATRMDPTDLPGYAGRVHDYFISHPDRSRLMRWGQLELVDDITDDPTAEVLHHKTEQLRQAQEAGRLDPSWDPLVILTFVNQLAMSWVGGPELPLPAGRRERELALEARRAAIVTAVERLFSSAAHSDGPDLPTSPG